MNHEFALRLVIFEYLLPEQRRKRCNCLCNTLNNTSHSLFGSGIPPYEKNKEGFFEYLMLFSDQLLGIRGYPSSFITKRRMISINRNLDALFILDANYYQEMYRVADPPVGYRIFNGRLRSY